MKKKKEKKETTYAIRIIRVSFSREMKSLKVTFNSPSKFKADS